MRLEWIYKIIPVPVFFTTKFLKTFAGRSFGIFCIIHPTHRHDLGLLMHELQHCRQWYRTLGIHGILYHFSKRYRYRAELEAYNIQLTYIPIGEIDFHITLFAGFITTKYNLEIWMQNAIIDLKELYYG